MLNLQKSILANKHGRDGYSTPCANIMTNPGSTITSSLMCGLSQLNTNTACLPVDWERKRERMCKPMSKLANRAGWMNSDVLIDRYLEYVDTHSYRMFYDCFVSFPESLSRVAIASRGTFPLILLKCVADSQILIGHAWSSSKSNNRRKWINTLKLVCTVYRVCTSKFHVRWYHWC